MTNVFGMRPVTFGHVRPAVQKIAGTIAPGTSRTLTFSGQRSVTVPAGKDLLRDPVRLRVATRTTRNFAVSVFVKGTSGPMTWHAPRSPPPT